jgi:2-methylcitrate dehydratase PrpD
MSKSTAMTVEKIAAFIAGCDNQSIASDVRDRVAKHLLDSIGCAIGAIEAKVTLKIKSVRVPYLRAERRSQQGPSEGDAGDPDDR